MARILPFASSPDPVWTPIAEEIHAAIWDRVGLGPVQEHVREWAADWIDRRDNAEPEAVDSFHDPKWQPISPELPLPPSHLQRSLAEKWAALAAVHDVFDFTGEKVLPWPVPEDDENLKAFSSWMRGAGGAYSSLMREASESTAEAASCIRRWLSDVAGDSGEPNVADSKSQDGPVRPDGFRWGGEVYRPIAKGPFLALLATWSCSDRCIYADDMPRALGDSEAMLADYTMPSIRGELNDFFRQNEIPYHAIVKGRFFAIKDSPPRPAKRSTKTPKKTAKKAPRRNSG